MGKKSREKREKREKNSAAGYGSSNNYGKLSSYARTFRKKWFLGLLIFVFSFLVYAPSLGNGFVWDDAINIKKRSYRFENKSLFRNIIPDKKENKSKRYFRPFIATSLVIDYKLWDDNPFGYHLTNNLLFSLTSLVLFILTLLILKEFHVSSKEYIAGLATLVYIVHPMHVESVSWISGRTDIICTLFFLMAFVFHILSYRNILFFPLCILMLSISFYSKEIAVAFPFLLLAFDFLKSKNRRFKHTCIISLIYFSILTAYLILRSRSSINIPEPSSQIIGKSAESSADLFYYIKSVGVMLNSYLFYFIRLVFPFRFNALISEVPKLGYYTFFSVMIFFLLSIWSFFSIKLKSGLKAFGILWIVLTLGPSVLVSIFQIAATPLAERYLFLPSCGFSILAAYTVFPYIRNNRSFVLLFLSICLLAAFNVSRQLVWKDKTTFWNAISHDSKQNAVAKINLGLALIEEKKIDEGIRVFKDLIESEDAIPGSVKSIVSNNIGIAYLNKNQPLIAKQWFLKGVNYNPDFHKSYFHLALIDYTYAIGSNSPELYKKSEQNLIKAIEKNKRYSRAYLYLAKIYSQYNDIARAKEYAKKALDLGLARPLDEDALQILNR